MTTENEKLSFNLRLGVKKKAATLVCFFVSIAAMISQHISSFACICWKDLLYILFW